MLRPVGSSTAIARRHRQRHPHHHCIVKGTNPPSWRLTFSTAPSSASAQGTVESWDGAHGKDGLTEAWVHRTKPRVVILGSGWAGFTLARRLSKESFHVRVISPANHFLFTPLLPSTAVGTLEFRAIQEPVRTIEGLDKYYQAKARSIDIAGGVVKCEDAYSGGTFDVPYDYLCVAGGKKSNTFGVKNVAELEGKTVFFLKHLYHARQIRNRILECFEQATNPTLPAEQRDRLLSFIVVGGGPTSCEFMSELQDFVTKDVAKWYPDLIGHIKLTLVEAGPGILGSFDKALSDLYVKKLIEKGVDVRLNTAVKGIEVRQIEGIRSNTAVSEPEIEGVKLRETEFTVANFGDFELPFGAMIWSAGLAPVKLVENSGLKLVRGQIAVDGYLRVPNTRGRVFALGDCASIPDPLPPTAVVAEQQGLYLADCFNEYYSKFNILDKNNRAVELPLPGAVTPHLMPWGILQFMNKVLCKSSPKFQFMDRGSMASMGMGGGVSQIGKDLPLAKSKMSGRAAYFIWSSTYLTKQLSLQNMILIPMYWFKAMMFGRDISRF